MRKASATLITLVAIGGVHCSSDTGDGTGLEGSGGRAASGGTIGVAGNMTVAGSGGTIPGTGGGKGIGVGGTIGVSGTSNAGTSSSTGGTGGACTADSATGMKGQSAVVMLLVDTSLSMNERAMGDDQTKLAATKEALNNAIDALPDGLGIGLIFYPGAVTAPACFNETVAVPIAPLDAAQRGALTTAVTGVQAANSTPTHDAYVYALAQLQATTLEGDRYLVLITDGIPTYALGCEGTGMPPGPGEEPVDTGPLVTESESAFTTNMVKTFVIGSPGSEGAREALSAMARVGGTGTAGCSDTGTPEYCHFDMTESTDVAAGLEMVLGEITEQIPIDCNFEIPPPPNSQDTIDPTRTNVVYNGMPIPYDQTCTASPAWQFDDPAQPEQVIFCGSLCDTVKADMMAEVKLEFGCTRIDVPR
jgi:hypothetical protein